MKLSERVLPFLKSTPLFYQTLPFYGKNLKPPFFEKIYESLGQIANVLQGRQPCPGSFLKNYESTTASHREIDAKVTL